jgi:xylulokinase
MLEALAFWTRRNLEEMTTLAGRRPADVALIGGAHRISLLCELKANALNRPMRVSRIPQAAAVGAALLAGLGVGVYRDPAQAVASLNYQDLIIQPDPILAAWYDRLYKEAYLPLYGILHDLNWTLARIEGSNP